MKVIDLLNKIANGEEIPIVKFKLNQHRFKYNKKDKMFDDIDDFSRCKCTIEFCELNDEVEIIEEQQYLDIQELKEIDLKQVTSGDVKTGLVLHINQLVQAVKQLDKKIRSE